MIANIAPSRGLRAAVAAAVLCAAALGAHDAGAQEKPDILGAILALRAVVPADARTAETLGTERNGTGVVIDSNGLVLTIGYLILEASEVTLHDGAGGATAAQVVGYDHRTGFGLLRALKPLGNPLRFGNSQALEALQPVLVVGRGDTEIVSVAQVTARKEFAGSWEYLLDNAIFTAPAHRRHSGAALVNIAGELLGIGSLVLPQQVAGVGMIAGNMFVPIDALKPILADLIAGGRPSGSFQPWLGLAPEEVRGHLFVERVSPDGPAEAAGVKPGDLILGIDGQTIGDMATFFRRTWSLGPAGVEVPLDIVRAGVPRRVVVKSADRHAWLRVKRSY